MTIIKSHVCKMCGGLLDIDLDRQVYVCSFCGVTYDYEYFREDNVLEVARKSLARGEFGAAKDAFDFILKKNPHDFEALRGLFLCVNRWRTMSPILKSEGVHFSDSLKELVYAKDNCLPEHKDYFEMICEAARLNGKYKENRLEAQKIDDKRSVEVKTLNYLKDEFMIYDSKFVTFVHQLMEKKTAKGESVFSIILILSVTIIAFLTFLFGWWIPVVFAAIIILITVVYNVKKYNRLGEIQGSIDLSESKIEKMSEECRSRRAEAEKFLFRFKMQTKEIINSDPLKKKKEDRNDDKKDADIDDEEDYIGE